MDRGGSKAYFGAGKSICMRFIAAPQTFYRGRHGTAPECGLGQSRGIIVVFIALGNGEQALPHQGQEIMFNLAGITGVMEAPGGFFGESVTPVQLPEQRAASIRGYPATL